MKRPIILFSLAIALIFGAFFAKKYYLDEEIVEPQGICNPESPGCGPTLPMEEPKIEEKKEEPKVEPKKEEFKKPEPKKEERKKLFPLRKDKN